MPNRTSIVRDHVHVELVRSLFATIAPSAIMSFGFAVSAWLICSRSPDRFLFALAIAGILSSIFRIVIVLYSRNEARAPELCAARATALERWFGGSYIAFAVALGLFGAHALNGGSPETHILTICLLVGYAAGVAAGVGLRPWIAIPSMLCAVIPGGMMTALSADPIYWATGAMLAAFLAGGIHSLLDRHKTTKKEIEQRIIFAGLARRDALTALPNRLALREWFDANACPARSRGIIAVHCLDLDGFKPVNDRFGHPAGDDLLRAVSDRLARIVRSGDIAARMGGDEFVVVQSGLRHADEADLLAQRICKAIKAPYDIGGQQIRVSACIGYVTSNEESEDLDRLLSWADEALYSAKALGGRTARFVGEPRSKRSSKAA